MADVPLAPLGPRVFVPGYIKADGTQVSGYWRDQAQFASHPPLVRAGTFRAPTFRNAPTFKRPRF